MGKPEAGSSLTEEENGNMGFKPWRNLGVLALAGASLVGCASTPPQNTKLVAPPPQNNSWNMPAGQTPPPPNASAFGAQQPSANGGFDNQQRQTVQGGFPQAGAPANPNAGFNTSSGTQNFNGYNSPPPTSPANSYNMAPNGGTPQSYYNPSLQVNSGNVGAAGTQSPNAGGPAPTNMPPLPSFPPAPTGGFTPPPAPTGFGTAPR
jgi:hypothetical protein